MDIAKVIHFGNDDCHRVQSLRRVGFEVFVSNSLDRLRLQLESETGVGAVLVSEETPQQAEQAAALVREYCDVPLILFRDSEVALDESRYDRVYTSRVPTPHWLYETAVLVDQSQTLRTNSERLKATAERLIKECKSVCRNVEWQRARARLYRRRNTDANRFWKLDDDGKK
jgi:hypothetical protein